MIAKFRAWLKEAGDDEYTGVEKILGVACLYILIAAIFAMVALHG